MHPRIKKEKKILDIMIKTYCKETHKCEETCDDCKELMEYAEKRLLSCPFIENKPVCSKCSIHCYNKQHKEKIKEIMKTVGPKMIYTHTFLTLWYFFYKFIHKNQHVA